MPSSGRSLFGLWNHTSRYRYSYPFSHESEEADAQKCRNFPKVIHVVNAGTAV